MYRFNYRINKIIAVLVLIFSLNTVSFPQDNNLKERFESNKSNVINILTNHSLSHKNCILNSLDNNIILSLSFLPSDIQDKNILGYPVKIDNKNVLVYNQNNSFPDNTIKLFIIHEMLHIQNICGSDNRPQMISKQIPSCMLFGKNMYYSRDINQALITHIQELN